MTNEETKLLVEVSTRLNEMAKTMEMVSKKMDLLQSDHVTNITSRMAVSEEKVSRLEKIVYGLIALAAAQAIAILFQYINP